MDSTVKTLYDALIIGAGPAGIFAGIRFLEAIENGADLSVLILDRGPDVPGRYCPARETSSICTKCSNCALQTGWGGAGTFSDGKITLTPSVGGWLSEFLGSNKVVDLLSDVDRYFLRFGAPDKLYGVDDEQFHIWSRRAALADLKLERNVLRHLGTDLCKDILTEMKRYLSKHIEIRLGERVQSINAENSKVRGISLSSGESIASRTILAAPGRYGATWLSSEASRLGLGLETNPVDLGIRAELPSEILAPLTDELYEPKLKYVSKTFDDTARTFCVNPCGQVITEYYDDVVTVNGHSLRNGSSPSTNFAILVSSFFTEPFKDPISYGKYIARLANIISDGIIVQRLWDLLQGQRSTSQRIGRSITVPTLKGATPGDISFVMPHRIMTDIVEMLKALDKMVPGVMSQNTLLYGVEAKFYSLRVQTDHGLQTSVKDLFVAGDGAGITRGLSQAAASGLSAADSMLRSMGLNKTP